MEVKEGWLDGWQVGRCMYGAGTCDLWGKMYGQKQGRRDRVDVNSWNQLPLCLLVFVPRSPITICVNGNGCQARQ